MPSKKFSIPAKLPNCADLNLPGPFSRPWKWTLAQFWDVSGVPKTWKWTSAQLFLHSSVKLNLTAILWDRNDEKLGRFSGFLNNSTSSRINKNHVRVLNCSAKPCIRFAYYTVVCLEMQIIFTETRFFERNNFFRKNNHWFMCFFCRRLPLF